MKANLGKFQFIILGNTGSHTLQIGDITVKSTSSVTLLGINIDLQSINIDLKNRYAKTFKGTI